MSTQKNVTQLRAHSRSRRAPRPLAVEENAPDAAADDRGGLKRERAAGISALPMGAQLGPWHRSDSFAGIDENRPGWYQ